jgi:hypothetical protein
MSEFNKKVGKHIDKEKADKMMTNWKKFGLKTQSSFFGSDIINELLNSDPNVVGLSINYALDDDGNMQPVLTPVIESGSNAKATTFGDSSLPCPPYCTK